MALDWAYPAKRAVFSGPTSYAMEFSGWYWEKWGETLWAWTRTVERECKNLNKPWPDLKQLAQSRVRWRCPMSRSGSRKLRRRRMGDRMQPWRTPLWTSKGSDNLPLCSTRHLAPSYVAFIIAVFSMWLMLINQHTEVQMSSNLVTINTTWLGLTLLLETLFLKKLLLQTDF